MAIFGSKESDNNQGQTDSSNAGGLDHFIHNVTTNSDHYDGGWDHNQGQQNGANANWADNIAHNMTKDYNSDQYNAGWDNAKKE